MGRRPNSNTDTRGAVHSSSSEMAPTTVQALPQTNPGYIRGALQAFTKKVLLFVRQSSMQQVHKHRSSVDVQLRQIEHFNVTEDRIIRVMALGEKPARNWSLVLSVMRKSLNTEQSMFSTPSLDTFGIVREALP